MASPTPPIIPQSAVINHLVRNEMAKPPKRKIKISDEPEITFDEQGNELLVEDRKQNLIDEALEASRVANDKEEVRFFREQARENLRNVERKLREDFGLERHYGGFRPISIGKQEDKERLQSLRDALAKSKAKKK